MSTNSSDSGKQLDDQMENMCHYLEKLVTCDNESNDSSICDAQCNTAGVSVLNNLKLKDSHVTGAHHGQSLPRFNFNIPPTTLNNEPVGAPPPCAPNTVTSVLANASNINSSTPRYGKNSTTNPKMKNRMSFKQFDPFPDTSGIDIDATMKELGLTPEGIAPNKVHQLFLLYSNLEFTIHAEFISTTIYDRKTIPNTMSVSAQTKYAIWSNNNLLNSLREVLKRPMPAEYKSAFDKCEESLDELRKAIINLERFKSCILEHRKGDFVTKEAEEYLQPLMDALNLLTKRVEKSRMYVQVYERALNAPERYKAALLRSCQDYPEPVPEESYTETASCSRPEMARRYIG